MKEAQKFVIVNKIFGYDMFVIDSSFHSQGLYVTDRIDEREVFTRGEDNPDIKCRFFSTVTGLPGFEAVDIH